MKLTSKQISCPKIVAFLKVFPFLLHTYASRPFEVRDAIKRVNANSSLPIWCHQSGKIDIIEKKKQESSGKTSLDLQNACHCFSGRTQSAIIDLSSGKEIRLLDWIDKMTYKIADGAADLFKEIQDDKLY